MKSSVEKLQGARSLNEVMSIVDVIQKRIDTLGKQTAKFIQSISSSKITINLSAVSADERELSDFIKKPNSNVGKKAKGSLRSVLDKNFKTPTKKEMATNTTAVQELSDSIGELEVAIRVLSSKQFSRLEESKQTIKMIKAIILQAEDHRKTQLDALDRISKNYIPKNHKSIIKATRDILKASLDSATYSGFAIKSYILNPAPNTIYFQTFVLVKNLINAEGFNYEQYSYVITSVLDQTNFELVPHITSLKDPRIPGSFPIGKEIKSVPHLKQTLQSLAHIDSLHVQVGRQKLSSIRKTEDLGILKGTKNVKGLRVRDSELFVKIDPGLSDRQKKDLTATLRALIRQIFIPKSKNRSIGVREIRGKRSVGGKSPNTFLVFAISRNVDTRSKDFIDNVDRLVKTLKLGPRLSREVIRDMVEQYGD